jgi:hypothetical protein
MEAAKNWVDSGLAAEFKTNARSKHTAEGCEVPRCARQDDDRKVHIVPSQKPAHDYSICRIDQSHSFLPEI